jgi:hypothetical protein
MSYSYIKSVFPNFEESPNYEAKPKLNTNEDQVSYSKPVSAYDSSSFVEFQHQKATSTPNIQSVNRIESIERFENSKVPMCEEYLQHVLECNHCKDIIMKQFNIESERIRNEEIMEVVGYIMFGVFMLMLLDSLKKQ